LVRIPACHAGGRGFEPRPLRQESKATTVRWPFCLPGPHFWTARSLFVRDSSHGAASTLRVRWAHSAQVEKPSIRRCLSQCSGRGAVDNKVLQPSSGGWRPSAMRCTMSDARNKCMGGWSFSSTIRSATMSRSPNCESRGSPSANTRARSLPSTATPKRRSTVHPTPTRTAPKVRQVRLLHRSLG
jgi:hypothetical protein